MRKQLLITVKNNTVGKFLALACKHGAAKSRRN